MNEFPKLNTKAQTLIWSNKFDFITMKIFCGSIDTNFGKDMAFHI